jgi:hypothetical protein
MLMSSHTFGARRSWLGSAALAALDAGLQVHVETHPAQRTIFSGAENLSAQDLASELAYMLSSLRIRSFRVRADVEDLASAVLSNLECGFWLYARRAAQDLAGTLASTGKRRLADRELCVRGANAALRISELCVEEACR